MKAEAGQIEWPLGSALKMHAAGYLGTNDRYTTEVHRFYVSLQYDLTRDYIQFMARFLVYGFIDKLMDIHRCLKD
jgi:hypothetical protein